MSAADVVVQPDGPDFVGFQDLLVPGHTLARLYYPTAAGADGLTDAFIRQEYLGGTGAFLGAPSLAFFTAVLGAVAGRPKVAALAGAAPLVDEQPLPVVVFSPGAATYRGAYAFGALELAAHGFLVVVVEHRDGSQVWSYDVDASGAEVPVPMDLASAYPPNAWNFTLKRPQQELRVAELRRAIDLLRRLNAKGSEAFGPDGVAKPTLGADFDWDLLKGHLDMDRLALMGHSFGGGAVLETLAQEPSALTAVLLDAWLFATDRRLLRSPELVAQPLLFLNADQFTWPDNLRAQRRFWASSAERQTLTLLNATHSGFGDFPLFLQPPGNQTKLDAAQRGWLDGVMALLRPPSPERQLRHAYSLCRAWLAKHLGLHGWESLDVAVAAAGAEAVRNGSLLRVPSPLPAGWDAVVEREVWPDVAT